MQELIKTVARKEVCVVKRKVVERPMGGAGAYQEGGTLNDFLKGLENSINGLEANGFKVGDIEIATDGKNFAATMTIGK